jgi:hypothetical protein
LDKTSDFKNPERIFKIPKEKIRGLFVHDEKALREKTFGFFPAKEFSPPLTIIFNNYKGSNT